MESKPSSPLGIEDIDEKHKMTMIKSCVVVATIALIPLSIHSINNNNLVIGVLDFLFAGILLVLLFFITKKKYFTQISQIGIFIAGIFFFYLFMNKSASNTGHFWSFTFPLFSFFILGYQRGLKASLLLILAIFLYLLFQHSLPFDFEPYPFNFSVRLIPAYLLILMFSYIFEKLREKGIESLFLKNKEIKQVVAQLEGKDDELRAANKNLEKRVNRLKKAEEEIRFLAFYDGLTGLANRMLFMDRLDQVRRDSTRKNKHFALLFLDLDNFKRINDTLGHHIGDLLLKKVADTIKNSIRDSDSATRMSDPENLKVSVVARFGGDEFIILAEDIDGPESAALIARRLIGKTSEIYNLDGHDVSITTSIGISVFPEDGREADVLLKNADTAMYHAKHEGKNTYQFFADSMNKAILERFSIDRDLRKAIQRNEFVLYYQPKIDMPTRKIIGAEALIRWEHPNRGMISPDKFIPIAKETGIIIDINKWVLYEACRQAAQWKKEGYHPITIAINLSGYKLASQNIIQSLKNILDETQFDGKNIEIEITENIIMQDTDETISILNKIKDLNLSIAMDDFGTGYSSLSYLTTFPVDTIKIDRSFVMDCTAESNNLAIIKAIIAMGHSLGKKIVAEGIETEEQYHLLNKLDCDEAQGYYFKHPVPTEEFVRLLANGYL